MGAEKILILVKCEPLNAIYFTGPEYEWIIYMAGVISFLRKSKKPKKYCYTVTGNLHNILYIGFLKCTVKSSLYRIIWRKKYVHTSHVFISYTGTPSCT
jgi:hypothetical protein